MFATIMVIIIVIWAVIHSIVDYRMMKRVEALEKMAKAEKK